MDIILYDPADPERRVPLRAEFAAQCEYFTALEHFYSGSTARPDQRSALEIAWPLDDFDALSILVDVYNNDRGDGHPKSVLNAALERERPSSVSPKHKPFKHAFAGRLWKVADFLGWVNAMRLLESFTHKPRVLSKRRRRNMNCKKVSAENLEGLECLFRSAEEREELIDYYLSMYVYLDPDERRRFAQASFESLVSQFD
jgi:hypothetical protein